MRVHRPTRSVVRSASTAVVAAQLRACSSKDAVPSTQRPSNVPSSSTVKGAKPPLRGIRVADFEEGFGGFDTSSLLKPGHGSMDAFINVNKRKVSEAAADGVLPCDVPDSTAAAQSSAAAEEEMLAKIAATGKLPSPKRTDPDPRAAPSPQGGGPMRRPPSAPPSNKTPNEPTAISRASSLPRPLPEGKATSLPRKPLYAKPTQGATGTAAGTGSASLNLGSSATTANKTPPQPEYTGASDAEAYYKDVPRQELSKEEMWTRIQEHAKEQSEANSTALDPTEAEYLKMEEELKEHDLFHYRVGEAAFPDETTRRDYWAVWQLAISLNKARWSMLEVHAQRGVKTTGAGMKMLFWKESIYQIAEKKEMASGQFVDSHPILRPFAAAVKRSPTITKTFVRGFADARLKVLQQPGNVKQLFDHFDKFYGYFFNVLLEILGTKDDHAEHAMCHIGRAIGLTQHCVMFWKKYAKLGFTMLPADLCADNHVNLTLLKNVPLASRDRAVRRLLCDVMAIAKEEMMHAQEAVKYCSPKVWPILTEAFYPNYYLGFLQKHEFNVSAMFADHNIENAGFSWYRLKKRWEWERHHDLQRLIAEPAPLPIIGTSWGHRGSQYRKATAPSAADAQGGGGGASHGHSHDGGSGHGHSHGGQ